MIKGQPMLALSLGAFALVALCALSFASPTEAADDKPIVILDTTAGPITIELDPAKAPITVENFLKYVDSGYFDNLIFHRVIPGFMIQGGGFDANMREKAKTNPPIQNEGLNGLLNKRGTLAMARTSDPNSATAQFFINLVDNDFLDAKPGRPGYAVFGRVIEGMDAVDAIAKVQTTRKGPHEGVPVQPMVIKSAKRKKA